MSATPDSPLPETLVSPAAATQPPLRNNLSALTSDLARAAFEEANRDLLHKRLLICEWVTLAGSLVLLIVTLLSGRSGASSDVLGTVTIILFCVGGVVGLIALRGRPSLRRLRTTEVVLFGSFAVF